jgi:hypothetical protein
MGETMSQKKERKLKQVKKKFSAGSVGMFIVVIFL